MKIMDLSNWWQEHKGLFLSNWPGLEIKTSLTDTWEIAYVMDHFLSEAKDQVPQDIEVDDENWIHFSCKDNIFNIYCSPSYLEKAFLELQIFGSKYNELLLQEGVLEPVQNHS